jgi:hypothetical protein
MFAVGGKVRGAFSLPRAPDGSIVCGRGVVHVSGVSWELVHVCHM